MRKHRRTKYQSNPKIIGIIRSSTISELDKDIAIKHILQIAKSDARSKYCSFKYDANTISNLFTWNLVNPGYTYWCNLAIQLGETKFTHQLNIN